MYKQIRNIEGSINEAAVQNTNTTSFIPFDPDNKDYQAYLKWLEEGNEPLPADEPAA